MSETFTCAACGGTFEKVWSDQEAAEEYMTKFPDDQEEVAVVCDDCYKAMGLG